MGRELGPAYHELWNEWVLIHVRWAEYIELYDGSEAGLDVMKATARGFFSSVQEMYWENILLHLSRFADAATFRNKPESSKRLSLAVLTSFAASRPLLDLDNLIKEAIEK